jgi:hypothetical protein
MASVQPATPAMFDDIHPLLARLNPAVSRDQWQRLVDYGWRSGDEGIGYVLADRQRIVGFLGTLFSRRTINGRDVRLCNTTNWVVQDEFRGQSFLLFLAVLKLRDCTITNLTSSPKVAAMMAPLGFKPLDTRVRLLFPTPGPPWRRPAIATDRATILATLDAADAKIYADHAGCDCGHLVVRPDPEEAYCYLVFTRKHRAAYGARVPYCHVHYISNRAVFERHLGAIKRHFLTALGAWFVAVDERLVGNGAGPLSRAYRLSAPRYFRSDVLAAGEIDNLYTELVVLGQHHA